MISSFMLMGLVSRLSFSYRLEMGVSGNLWIVVKDVKTLVVYDVE